MYKDKIKLLEELMGHLGSSQGQDLKSTLDEYRKPKEEEMEIGEDGQPKGVKIQSVELMKNPMDDVASNDKMSDKKTLGEAIGYPGFKKEKPTAMMGSEMMKGMSPISNEEDEDPTDDEIEMLMKRYQA